MLRKHELALKAFHVRDTGVAAMVANYNKEIHFKVECEDGEMEQTWKDPCRGRFSSCGEVGDTIPACVALCCMEVQEISNVVVLRQRAVMCL